VAAIVGLWTGVVPAPGLDTAHAMMPVKTESGTGAYTADDD